LWQADAVAEEQVFLDGGPPLGARSGIFALGAQASRPLEAARRARFRNSRAQAPAKGLTFAWLERLRVVAK
jgi:hypothetical protein